MANLLEIFDRPTARHLFRSSHPNTTFIEFVFCALLHMYAHIVYYALSLRSLLLHSLFSNKGRIAHLLVSYLFTCNLLTF